MQTLITSVCKKDCKDYTDVISVQESQILLVLLFHFYWNAEGEFLNNYCVADNSKVNISNVKHIAQWIHSDVKILGQILCLYWTSYMWLICVCTFAAYWWYCSHLVYKGSFNLHEIENVNRTLHTDIFIYFFKSQKESLCSRSLLGFSVNGNKTKYVICRFQ